ncbi:MAG: hypothetical protein H6779_04070 [Candidatus Nomurabacteria bacterium]|nr:MAG: hypothetical protein H6779_04070 [Candidatus Nomurabacteria bacterium]
MSISLNTKQSGFALLISLIVVGVVVSVGLTILDLTIKQLSLSTNSKDSEIAFHAANAGLECAQYWRIKEEDNLEQGNDVVFECFGQTLPATSKVNIPSADLIKGNAHTYDFKFTWGAASLQRCSEVRMLLLTSDDGSTGAGVDNVSTYIPGYVSPSGNNKFECEPGGRCTLTSVRGYNQSCGGASSGVYGTLQREVLLES